MSNTRETVTFENTVGSQYYAYMNNYEGYGGFVYVDLIAMGKDYLYDVNSTVDSGYRSALHGKTEIFTTVLDNTYDGYGIGSFYSSSNTETFSLKGGIFASAWETNQPVDFISYVYRNGVLHKKASVTIKLSQTASDLNFSKYGADFRHIAGFKMISTRGSAGVYNHYYHSPTYGYEIAIDNLKVAWNGPIPHGARSGHHPPHTAVRPHALAHVGGAAHLAGVPHEAAAAAQGGGATHGYHSMLASLASAYEHTGSLTDQFALPHVSHDFGL